MTIIKLIIKREDIVVTKEVMLTEEELEGIILEVEGEITKLTHMMQLSHTL